MDAETPDIGSAVGPPQSTERQRKLRAPRALTQPSTDWRGLMYAAVVQSDLVTRSQCIAAGLTRDFVRRWLRSGKWVRLRPGVYLTKPGRSDRNQYALSGLLAAGGIESVAVGDLQPGPVPRVALAGMAAAREWGLTEKRPPTIDLVVPKARCIAAPKDCTVRRSHRWDDLVTPIFPWRTSVPVTVIDLASRGTADEALGWVAGSVQKGKVTVPDLAAELDLPHRVRHGGLLREVLADVAEGAQSNAEIRYIRDVERAHGLPAASRQSRSNAGQLRVHDNEYVEQRLIIEVDGRVGHEDWGARIKDGRRDRQVAGSGRWTSRVFWPDVAITPCETAREVGRCCASGDGRAWLASAAVLVAQLPG